MIITASKIPVPFDNAPVKSATAASKPTAAPPTIVNGQMYLPRIFSKTRSSLLNHCICNPEDKICFACDLGSIPAVCIQKILKIIDPVIIKKQYVEA